MKFVFRTFRATNPSEFSIEFFVNDLSTPGASTFQNIGVLEYNQNGPIHHVCDNKVRIIRVINHDNVV